MEQEVTRRGALHRLDRVASQNDIRPSEKCEEMKRSEFVKKEYKKNTKRALGKFIDWR